MLLIRKITSALKINLNMLKQRFPNCGLRTPRGPDVYRKESANINWKCYIHSVYKKRKYWWDNRITWEILIIINTLSKYLSLVKKPLRLKTSDRVGQTTDSLFIVADLEYCRIYFIMYTFIICKFNSLFFYFYSFSYIMKLWLQNNEITMKDIYVYKRRKFPEE